MKLEFANENLVEKLLNEANPITKAKDALLTRDSQNKLLDEILKNVQTNAENAGYKVKIQDRKSLYVLPADKFIFKFIETPDSGSDNILKLKVIGPNGEDITDDEKYNFSDIKVLDIAGDQSAEDPTKVSQVAQNSLTKLTEKVIATVNTLPNVQTLSEAVVNEANPFAALFNKIADTAASVAGKVQDKKDTKNFINNMISVVNNTIADSLKEFIVKTERSADDGFIITITNKGNYLCGVSFGFSKVDAKNIVADKLIDAKGQTISSKSLSSALNWIGKSLNINLTIDKDLMQKTGSDEEEVKASQEPVQQLKSQLTPDIQKYFESLNEAYDDKKYAEAYKNAGDSDKRIIAEMYLTEHQNEFNYDDGLFDSYLIKAIGDKLSEANFNIDSENAFDVKVLCKYAKILNGPALGVKSSLPNIIFSDWFAQTPHRKNALTTSDPKPDIEKLFSVKDLWDRFEGNNLLQVIKWYLNPKATKYDYKSLEAIKSKNNSKYTKLDEIKEKYNVQNEIKNTDDIRNIIFMKDSTTFRDYDEIAQRKNFITNGKIDKNLTGEDTDVSVNDNDETNDQQAQKKNKTKKTIPSLDRMSDLSKQSDTTVFSAKDINTAYNAYIQKNPQKIAKAIELMKTINVEKNNQ